MKVLLVPMSAMAETAGTFSRTVLLAQALKEANIEVATCAAEDINYKAISGVKNYFLSIPMPLGLPKRIAVHTFPAAQKLGITSRKSINSFEDVLHLTGNISYKYLKNSIDDVRRAIQEFNPDVVYSEFNLSAIIAAKLEKKRIFISASLPTQYEYSSTPRYASGLNKLLKEYGFAQVKSCLELFLWADKRFVPSCFELEPFRDKSIIFCGTWKPVRPVNSGKRDKILVYMGNGTISQRKMLKEVTAAFGSSKYSVYIAGRGIQKQVWNHIHTGPYFDFQALLADALLFINHGGQNSIVDGLIYGVPQIICAGKVFERKYNAKSVAKAGAGIEISYKQFSADTIRAASLEILSTQTYRENASGLGRVLMSLGGTKNIVDALNAEVK